jgi:hypothetical protein
MTEPEPSADGEAILWTAPGRKHELIYASYLKRLVGEPATADSRLGMLEGLAGLATPKLVALIEPADDTSARIIEEALGLCRGSDDYGPAFDLLASDEVFRTLLSLNPSLLTAVRVGQHGGRVIERPKPEEADAPAGGK